jgi:hypothetical protein
MDALILYCPIWADMVSFINLVGINCIHTLTLIFQGNLLEILRKRYPYFQWNPEIWRSSAGSKSQILFLRALRNVLGRDIEIESNYFGTIVKNMETRSSLQLDAWIPSLNIALEYQGHQHYATEDYWGDGHYKQMERDHHKMVQCKESNIDLIVIPYWWNMKVESLAGVLKEVRLIMLDYLFICQEYWMS